MKTLASRFVLMTSVVVMLCAADSYFSAAEDAPNQPQKTQIYVCSPPENNPLEMTNGANSLKTQKYGDSKVVRMAYDKLNEYRKEAVTRLKDKYDLDYTDDGTIRIKIEDVPLKVAQSQGILTAFRDTEDEGATVVVRVYAEYIVNGISDAREEVIHELTHAIMREKMGRDPYTAMEKWFREGTAMYIAKQGDHRIDFVLSHTLPTSPETVINGLEGKHTYNDYPEDYLAFKFIEAQYGADAIKTLIKAVVNDLVPYKAAIKEKLGVEFDEFCDKARQYALKEVANWRDRTTFIEQFNEGIAKYRTKDFVEAAKLFEQATGSNSAGIRGLSFYYAGRSYQQSNQIPKMVECFEKTVENSRFTSFANDALYWHITVLNSEFAKSPAAITQSDFTKLENLFKVLTRDYIFSNKLPDVAYYFGHFYKRAKEYKHAATQFIFVCDNFTRAENFQGAALNAGECLEILKRYDEALKFAKMAKNGKYPLIAKKADELIARLEKAEQPPAEKK